MAVGTFVIWLGVFYALSSDRFKKVMDYAVWAASGVSVVDYMFFGTKYGILTRTLIYEKYPRFSTAELAVNTLVIIAAVLLLWLIWNKKIQIVRIIYFAGIITLVGMSTVNIIKTNHC